MSLPASVHSKLPGVTRSSSRPAKNASGRIVANVLLAAAWLLLYRPVLGWLGVIFSRSDFRLNQLLLVGGALLIARQIQTGGLRPDLAAPLRHNRLALLSALGGSAAYLVTERFLDVNILSGIWFGAATYGLLGLWMDGRRWRQGWLAAGLVIGALPFGTHLQVFVGYPLRVFTAQLIGDGLSALGFASATADTILVFESEMAQVDLPCSGVRSLWTGGLFLMAATWIERRQIGFRWSLAAVGFAALLVAGNVLRVAAIVAVGPVAGWPVAAEIIHVPLGVLSFVVACCAALWLLRRLPALPNDAWVSVSPQSDAPTRASQSDATPLATRRLSLGLIAVVLGMTLLYAPRQAGVIAAALPAWDFGDLSTETLPLTQAELDWLQRDGADSVHRVRFSDQHLSGSMILIESNTWRGHHLPERCFEVYGLKLDGSSTQVVSHGFPVRRVSIGDGELSAAYWFQSADAVTDDYGSRIWADIDGTQSWVLVSVLFDHDVDPDDPVAHQLFLEVRDAVITRLSKPRSEAPTMEADHDHPQPTAHGQAGLEARRRPATGRLRRLRQSSALLELEPGVPGLRVLRSVPHHLMGDVAP